MRKFAYLLTALLLAVQPVSGAADLPDLGEAARSDFTLAQEARVGQLIMRDIRQSPSFIDDPELTEYLNSLGYTLAAASQDPSRQFNFFVLNDPTLNAFALPGGNIGVHTGLILATRHESELAGVLAHEISHITQNHLGRMLEQQKQMQLPTLAALALAIIAARSNPQAAQAAISVSQATAIQSQLNFTRSNEREADRIGLQTLSRAGFDPEGMVDFFKRLEISTRLMENNAPEYLRTHPLTIQRIADMEDREEQLPYHQRKDSTDYILTQARARFLSTGEKEAREYFQRQAAMSGSNNSLAAYYGLSLLALKQQDYAHAAELFGHIPKPDSNPMLLHLAAEIALKNNSPDSGLEKYRQALKRFPTTLSLIQAYASALLDNGRNGEAVQFLRNQLDERPNSTTLYSLLARAYAQQGRPTDQHQAQAEAYARNGNLNGAIEQLQLALRDGKNASFYQLSTLEARLRELKQQDRAERENKNP